MSHPAIEAYFERLRQAWPHSATGDDALTELRDHVEAAYEDACAAGLDTDEAAKQAISSCGDAVQLASKFRGDISSHRARWIMRLSTAGVVAGILVVLGVAVWWPGETTQPLVSPVQAQAPAQPSVPMVVKPEADEIERNNQKAHEKLATRMPAEFVEAKLPDVIALLSEKLELDFYLDGQGLADLGVDLDQPLFIKLREVRADMLLDLALRQLGGQDLDYVVRDGIVVITSIASLEDASEVKAYPVADLLKLHGALADGGGMEGGFPGAAPGAESGGAEGYAGPGGGFGGGGGVGGGMGGIVAIDSQRVPPAASALIHVIERTVSPESWESMGGSGTITYYGDMLVIRQSARVHRETDQVLALLRSTAAKKAAKK